MLDVKNVLAPIDFSENSQKVAEAAAKITGRFDAHLYLVFVVQNFDDYSGFFVPPLNLPTLVEELFQSAQHRMDDFLSENKEIFTTSGVKEVSSEVLTGDVAEEIMSLANERMFDLIVMGTHGYKGVERILFGSVAEKVVKKACCPVLTVNPYNQCTGVKK
ncbi:MAG: universal stress protein [Desulfobulbaceae bacterium]|nr:universal stress protein [Desulfobulbaceae bacterium]